MKMRFTGSHAVSRIKQYRNKQEKVASKYERGALPPRLKRQVQACSSFLLALNQKVCTATTFCRVRAEAICTACMSEFEGWLLRLSDQAYDRVRTAFQRASHLRLSPSLRIHVGMLWESDPQWAWWEC